VCGHDADVSMAVEGCARLLQNLTLVQMPRLDWRMCSGTQFSHVLKCEVDCAWTSSWSIHGSNILITPIISCNLRPIARRPIPWKHEQVNMVGKMKEMAEYVSSPEDE